MGCGAPLEMGGENVPDERAYCVGMLVHDWLDHRRPEGRAAMTSDEALTLGVLIALVAAIVAIVAGEVTQRWRRR